MRNVNFVDQPNFFLSRSVKEFTFFEKDEKQFKMFIEMYIVQHAETKSVFTFQPIKIPVFTTVKTAKPALTC